MKVLVIDVGTSSVRATIAGDDGTTLVDRQHPLLPATPFPGLVEFDALAMAVVVTDLAQAVLADVGLDAAHPVDAVGITNQRASTVVWDPVDGVPVGPGIGWQDLRTVGECLALQAEGLHLAPNHSATKCAALFDAADPDRSRGLLFGTVDTWLVWYLSGGTAHVTDLTNASVTGMMRHDASGWDAAVLDRLRIPASAMPTLVDTAGPVAAAERLPGAPPITGIAGDQQASLIGQGCVLPGLAKITFGTGGMLDMWVGPDRPIAALRGDGGCFPLVTARFGGEVVWGIEAVMLAAGTNVEWLRDDLGLIASAAESHDLAQRCATTEGVVYVPALLGLGTPLWDYGARGALLGLTRGSTAAHVGRAVLEGVAHRGADLVESAEADAGHRIDALRVDGGMSANPTFVQALADATQRRIELSPVLEATTRGAALLALLGAGALDSPEEIAELWSPRAAVDPGAPLDRDRWREAVARSTGWHADLSSLSF